MPRRLLASVFASSLFVACTTADVEAPTYDFGLFPSVAHSGFNASSAFKVMFATSAKNPQWTIADPSIATLTPTAAPKIDGVDVRDLNFILVTATKAGETNISVSANGKTLTSKLVIKAYTDEQIALGKSRYETASDVPNRQPCAACHAKADGVDHSPLKMAGFDDPTILTVIQEATYPASATGGSTTSAFAPKGPLTKYPNHRWNLTDPEKDAILAHLRSLPLGGVK